LASKNHSSLLGALAEFKRGRLAAILILVCLALYLPGFFSLPPVDRDESRFAQASKQMLESEDFIDIRFQDTPRYKKPVGIYWLQAASAALLENLGFDDKIWSYRLPSLFGMVCAVIFTWLIGTRLFGAQAGIVAALMLAGSLIAGYEARQAKTDAVLLAAVVAAQYLLAKIYLNWLSGVRIAPVLSYFFWVAIAFGVLVKGPIIVLVSGGTVIVLMIWNRSWGLFRSLRPATGILLASVITLPWFLAVASSSGGEFFEEAVGKDLLGKVFKGQETHGAPPGYYLAAFWFTFWPWAVFAGLSVRWAWRNRADATVRFCIAWLLSVWPLFEIFATKLPHYVMPTYPSIALLIAASLGDRSYWTSWTKGIWEWIVVALSVLGATGLIALLAIAPAILDGRFSIGSAVAGVGIAFSIIQFIRIAYRPAQAAKAIIPLIAASFAVFSSAYAVILPGTDSIWLSVRVTEIIDERRNTCPETNLLTVGYDEPSLVFLNGTDTKITGAREAAEILAGRENCTFVAVSENFLEEFKTIAKSSGLGLQVVGEVNGFNYSSGRMVAISVFASK